MLPILIPTCAAILTAAGTPTRSILVAPNGNDQWTGLRSTPNRARTDGPVATVARALQLAAESRAKDPTRQVVISVRGGYYAMIDPLVVLPEHSGTAELPTVVRAFDREKPILGGGRRITGWTVRDGRWTVSLPEVANGRWRFEQLFVNGSRRYRPRLPKTGYYTIASQEPPSPAAAGKGHDRFRYTGSDIRAEWSGRRDVDILCFQQWTMARMKLAGVDAGTRVATLAQPTLSTVSFFALADGARYIVENVREALSEPGEWYLDRETGELTYIPLPGETPETAEVYAPYLENLVELRGDVDQRAWVQHVEFRGLTFAHSNWVCPDTGYQAPQAEVSIGAAIRAAGARHCGFVDCRVTAVGGYGVEFGAACQDDVLNGCEITDMGAGGVKLGETVGHSDPELLSDRHKVHNCLIAHGGRLHPAGIGIWIGASPHNVISHNEICDLYYTGISVGWSWGYAPTASHHNTLERNYIHHIGQGVLSDMGGTYTLGLAPGTVQRLNLFHDIESFSYGGWGIYFDEGTTGMVAERNVVYRTKSAGFHQHYGRDNIVRNNVFALNREAQLMRTRAEEHVSFTFEHNIVYWETGALLASNWSGSNYRFDQNLYWRVGGSPFDFAGASLDQWRARGHDVRSMVADPLFVDPRRGDFRLRPGSPALKIGFEPFDIREAGRLGRGSRRPEPVWQPRAYPAPDRASDTSVEDGFESTAVGGRPTRATVVEEGAGATIRVTDEQAFTGSRSLKFVDAPNLSANYNPHMFYSLDMTDGSARASFAMRLEKGTHMYHEWRDAAQPYHVGPALTVRADGALMARDRKLLDVPWGEWLQIEINCPLGARSRGRYDLTVRFPGRTAPLRFRDLPCAPAFSELRWFGFVADANAPGVFCIDDVSIRRGR